MICIPSAEKTKSSIPKRRLPTRPKIKLDVLSFLWRVDEYRKAHNISDFPVSVILHEARRGPIEIKGFIIPRLERDKGGVVFSMLCASDPILAPDLTPLTFNAIMEPGPESPMGDDMPASVYVFREDRLLVLHILGGHMDNNTVYFDCRRDPFYNTIDQEIPSVSDLRRLELTHYHKPAPCLVRSLKDRKVEEVVNVTPPMLGSQILEAVPLWELVDEAWNSMSVGSLFALPDSSVSVPPGLNRRAVTLGRLLDLLPKGTECTKPAVCTLIYSDRKQVAVLEDYSSYGPLNLKTCELRSDAESLDAFLLDLRLSSYEEFSYRWASRLGAWAQDETMEAKFAMIILYFRSAINIADSKSAFRQTSLRKLSLLLQAGFSSGHPHNETYCRDLIKMATDETMRKVFSDALTRARVLVETNGSGG